MYAISSSGYRAITKGMPLLAGESETSEIPSALMNKVRGEQMKAERSERLRATDWTQMTDAPLSVASKGMWATYRQALRDLPSLPNFPDVAWPSPPSLDGSADGNIKAPI